MDKEDVVHNGILLTHKKDKIVPLATTWIDPEGIMLSKISQTEKDNTARFHSYVEDKRTHGQREQISGYQRVRGLGGGHKV